MKSEFELETMKWERGDKSCAHAFPDSGRKTLCVHCDKSYESLNPDHKPQLKWKVGQMVCSKLTSKVYKLERNKGGDGFPVWLFRHWTGSGWSDIAVNTGTFDRKDYVSYPHVGDWVRCKFHYDPFLHAKNPFQFKGDARTDCDLEPSSPPVEQPKATLEGDHWDRISGLLCNSDERRALAELRAEFRRMLEAMKDAK